MADKNTDTQIHSQQSNNQWRIIFRNAWNSINSKGYWANFIISLILLFISPIISLLMNTYKVAIIGSAIGLTLLIWLIAITLYRQIPTTEALETELHGYLIPANELSPKTPCKKQPPPNAATIFVGSNAAWITDTPVVVLRVNEMDLLTLDNSSSGLSISAKVFSTDGKIIADIENNEFHVNPNNYFKVKRPDRSSLLVYDQQARLVLNVRFLNSTNIKVSGIFNVPNQEPIIIDDEKINRPSSLTNNCFGKKSVVIQIDEKGNFIGGN